MKPKATKDRNQTMQIPISAFFGGNQKTLKVAVDSSGRSIAREPQKAADSRALQDSRAELDREAFNKRIYREEPPGFFENAQGGTPASVAPNFRSKGGGGFLPEREEKNLADKFPPARQQTENSGFRKGYGKSSEMKELEGEIPFTKEQTSWRSHLNNENSQKTDSLSDGVELLDEFGILFDEKSKQQPQGPPPQKKFLLPYENKFLWEKRLVPLLNRFRAREIKSVEGFLDNMKALVNVHLDVKTINIMALEDFMRKLSVQEEDFFLGELLPFLGELALQLKELFPNGLNILARKQKGQVTLNKRRVACLVANMFFCTISNKAESVQLPPLKNFSNLFRRGRASDEVSLQKIACLYNYFKRCLKDLPDLNVMYQRVSFEDGEKQLYTSEKYWRGDDNPLCEVEIRNAGNIEDTKGSIQVDFANKMIGGGVLSFGCVQEEIRFCISPELFPSLLIFETMEDDEAVLVYGAEQFSRYEGYGSNFKFKGNIRDDLPLDSFNRKDVVILAIDARNYRETLSKSVQFKTLEIVRELAKAYLGFRGDADFLLENEGKKSVATGRWGCGAFDGDSQLKFLIQWIAASEANRKMIFYPYGDKDLKDLENVVKLLSPRKTVGDVFKILQGYFPAEYAREKSGRPLPVFDYLRLNLK